MPYSYFDYGLPYTKVISTVLYFYHIRPTRELIFSENKYVFFIDLSAIHAMGDRTCLVIRAVDSGLESWVRSPHRAWFAFEA